VTAPEFAPARFMRWVHAQTIFPALLPARPVRGPVSILDVPVAPRTQVRILITRPEGTAAGTLLLIHGLGGSAESRYMRRTAAIALAAGWAVARLNLRNCGGTETLAATLYNAGQSDDADAALRALDERGMPRPFGLMGFSLGGNIAMRYAGLSGDACRADAVVGVNPPIDLRACIDAIERPENSIYHAFFTRGLCAQMARIRKVREVPGPKATPGSIGGVRGFDERFTAPDAGYAGSAAYYAGASAAPVLGGIRRPSLILSAADDPFVPVGMFAAHRNASPRLTLAHPNAGGHCGYWGTAHPRYWAARAALHFFAVSISG
jgi:predicted alpha/beta-fold hydrolase